MAQPLLISCQERMKAVSCTKMQACCGGGSCSKEDQPVKQEKKNCTDANACNPFASCSQCQYVHPGNIFITAVNAILKITPLGLENENTAAGFMNDSFHPPEVL
jgi:hypothetical protein